MIGVTSYLLKDINCSDSLQSILSFYTELDSLKFAALRKFNLSDVQIRLQLLLIRMLQLLFV